MGFLVVVAGVGVVIPPCRGLVDVVPRVVVVVGFFVVVAVL